MKRLSLVLLLAALPAAAQQPYPQLQPGQFLPAVPPPSQPAAPPDAVPAITAPLPVPTVTPVLPEWLPMGTAELRALDKNSARVSTLTVKKGDTVKFGTLSITLRGCAIRPPDRPADSAAFLEITDSAGGPGLKGWMLVSSPALTVLEHPSYDVRPVACRP